MKLAAKLIKSGGFRVLGLASEQTTTDIWAVVSHLIHPRKLTFEPQRE